MNLKLTRKTWVVIGYKGGGKSSFAKWVAETYGVKCLYYDTLNEVPNGARFHSYNPKNHQSVDELCMIIRLLKQSRNYRMLIIDEANRFCPPKPARLPQDVADLNDWCRHPQFNMSVGYIARRPVQLNSDLVEIADYIIAFHLGGKNDIAYLNGLRAGLGDAVQNLPPYHFALINQNRTWEICAPIPLDKKYVGFVQKGNLQIDEPDDIL